MNLPTTRDLPPPPTGLEPDTYAARLYFMLGPLAQWDDTVGWSLLILANALGFQFQPVEDVVRDTPQGDPGWSCMLDLWRCPDYALPWLAQFAGVRLLPGSTPDEQRQRIASTDGFRRGTVAAMTGAAQATLTGLKRIDFRERTGGGFREIQSYAAVKLACADYSVMTSTYATYLEMSGSVDGAYYLTVRTYSTETPDPDATLRALLSQKPGGLVLDYAVVVGQTYAHLDATRADYAAVTAAYPDYLAVRQDET